MQISEIRDRQGIDKKTQWRSTFQPYMKMGRTELEEGYWPELEQANSNIIELDSSLSFAYYLRAVAS